MSPESIFSTSDIEQMRQLGIQREQAIAQLERFKTGFPPLRLAAPVMPGDGIFRLAEHERYVRLFDQKTPGLSVCKFVPASGAASRMFRRLFAYVQAPDSLPEREKELLHIFCQKLPESALFFSLKEKSKEAEKLLSEEQYKTVFEMILSGYGSLPKALIPFHCYEGFSRTALEEHLTEAAHYCRDANDIVRLHLTVSPEHKARFKQTIQGLQVQYDASYQCRFDVTISTQNPATNTLAVDMENKPFRIQNGELLFRPGGHGALLENLNNIDADIVFIKNVDNVLPEHRQAETWYWKKLLGGILLDTQQGLFEWQHYLDNHDQVPEALFDFVTQKMGIRIPKAVFEGESYL